MLPDYECIGLYFEGLVLKIKWRNILIPDMFLRGFTVFVAYPYTNSPLFY